jgi:cephalosporin-C deacetylase
MTRPAPERFETQVRRPAEFDLFWELVLEQAARIPLSPTLQLDPLRSTERVEVFACHYDSLDQVRIFGWYCRPRRRAGRLPAVLVVPGYISEPKIPRDLASLGYAAFSAAPRGKLRSNAQYNPGYPGLLTDNIVDPNTYGYRGFYIDTWRAIDFLLAREEIDSSRIGVTGSSQGGALTLVTAAMRPEICAAAAGAPYLCGMMDAVELTTAYPYQEVNDYLRLHPERREAVTRTLAYFDGINFAPRIACPIIVNLGLRDNICPPETGYAVFAAIGSEEKRLYAYPDAGHDAGARQHAAVVASFFKRHLGR